MVYNICNNQTMNQSKEVVRKIEQGVRSNHGPACIAFHCSHLYISNPGSVSHFAKTWVSLQTTTYISKSTKYFDILLLLTYEEVLHAPTVQI